MIDAVEAVAPDRFERIDAVIARGEREAIVNGDARLAGFAPDQVNDPVNRDRLARGALSGG